MPKASLKIQARNKKIKSSKMSIRKLSTLYKISYERVRQIKRGVENQKKEQYSKIEKEYKLRIKDFIAERLPAEIKRLSNKGRHKRIIIQKVILIKALRNDFRFPFSKIAKLFHNDLTTIKHLYSHKD